MYFCIIRITSSKIPRTYLQLKELLMLEEVRSAQWLLQVRRLQKLMEVLQKFLSRFFILLDL